MARYLVVGLGPRIGFARENEDGSLRLRSRRGAVSFTEVEAGTAEHALDVQVRRATRCRMPVTLTTARLAAGVAHPRIQRVPHELSYADAPPFAHLYADACAATLRAGASLVDLLRDLFRHAEPSPGNAACYGQGTRQLIVLACTEVEAGLRAVLRANDPTITHCDRLSTRDYVRLRDPMRLHEWELRLVLHPRYPIIRPFESWRAESPTKSLPWYDAYNAVKHDRESAIELASLEHAIQSVAAAVILGAAQFGRDVFKGYRSFDEFYVSEPPWDHSELYVHHSLATDKALRGAWRETPYFAVTDPVGPPQSPRAV